MNKKNQIILLIIILIIIFVLIVFLQFFSGSTFFYFGEINSNFKFGAKEVTGFISQGLPNSQQTAPFKVRYKSERFGDFKSLDNSITIIMPETSKNLELSDPPVNIINFAFSPSSLTINIGDSVAWTNNDNTIHTVTSDSGSELNSPVLQPGDSFSYTFNSPGTFNYHCNFHNFMRATIFVVSLVQTPVIVNPPANQIADEPVITPISSFPYANVPVTPALEIITSSQKINYSISNFINSLPNTTKIEISKPFHGGTIKPFAAKTPAFKK